MQIAPGPVGRVFALQFLDFFQPGSESRGEDVVTRFNLGGGLVIPPGGIWLGDQIADDLFGA